MSVVNGMKKERSGNEGREGRLNASGCGCRRLAPHAAPPHPRAPPHGQARFHALVLKVVGSWEGQGREQEGRTKAGCFRAMNGDGGEEVGRRWHICVATLGKGQRRNAQAIDRNTLMSRCVCPWGMLSAFRAWHWPLVGCGGDTKQRQHNAPLRPPFDLPSPPSFLHSFYAISLIVIRIILHTTTGRRGRQGSSGSSSSSRKPNSST